MLPLWVLSMQIEVKFIDNSKSTVGERVCVNCCLSLYVDGDLSHPVSDGICSRLLPCDPDVMDGS